MANTALRHRQRSKTENPMSSSPFRAAILTSAILASSSCGVMSAIRRTPDAIESNTSVLRGVERSTTALTPALQRVAALEQPLHEVSDLDSTLERVAGLQPSLVG